MLVFWSEIHRLREARVIDLPIGVITRLASTVGPGLTLALFVLLLPTMAATVVLTWHGLRGSNPGPAGNLLLKLVELTLRRGRRR